MGILIALIVLWCVALVVLLVMLLISISSLNSNLTNMKGALERLADALASGKTLAEQQVNQVQKSSAVVPQAVPNENVQNAAPIVYAILPKSDAVASTDPTGAVDVDVSAVPDSVVPGIGSGNTAVREESVQLQSSIEETSLSAAKAAPQEAVASEAVVEPAVAQAPATIEPVPEMASEAETNTEGISSEVHSLEVATPQEAPAGEAFAEQTVCTPREPSVLQRRLQTLRNWFVYGRAEGVAAGEAAEKLLATTWLLRSGILVILFTSIFLLKLSIERGILAPSGRVALSYLAGAALLWAGLSKRMRQRYWSMGQALCGISLGVFYFSSFAMTSMYHLVSAMVGGAVMCLTTITAGFLADRLNSISVALVAMIGGYATPLLLNTGAKNFPGLAAYLVLLGIGVLWLSYRRNWMQLTWISMLFTYGIFLLAFNVHYAPADFAVCQVSLVLFFVLFSTMVFIHNVRRSLPATALEIFGLLGNSVLFFGLSWRIIGTVNDGDRLFFAPLTLGLAAYYLLHAVVLSRRRDGALKGLLLIFCALSGLYLALTFPVVFTGEWLAAAWALQAFMMLWLGYRMESRLLKNCAWILYAITIGRLCIYEFWGYNTALGEAPTEEFWSSIVARLFQYLLPVGSIAAAARLTMKCNGADVEAIESKHATEDELLQNPVRSWQKNGLSGLLLGVSFIILFLFLRLEIGADLNDCLKVYRLTGINIVWIGGCLVALMLLKRGLPGWWLEFLVLLLGGTVLRVVIDFFNNDFWSWDVPQFAWSHCVGSICNTAVLVFGIMLCGRLMPDGWLERILKCICRFVWPVLLFVHLTREWGLIIKYKLPGLTGGGISVLWAIFAFVLVLQGLTKAIKPLRYIGLTLFAVVVCKVFLFDMSHLDAIYRVLAFFAFGVLLMGAAFVYLKFWRNKEER